MTDETTARDGPDRLLVRSSGGASLAGLSVAGSAVRLQPLFPPQAARGRRSLAAGRRNAFRSRTSCSSFSGGEFAVRDHGPAADGGGVEGLEEPLPDLRRPLQRCNLRRLCLKGVQPRYRSHRPQQDRRAFLLLRKRH